MHPHEPRSLNKVSGSGSSSISGLELGPGNTAGGAREIEEESGCWKDDFGGGFSW